MNNEQKNIFKKKIQKCEEEIEKIIDNVNLSGSIDIDKVYLYDLKKINDSVTKVYGIYQKFPDSEELACHYMSILWKLAQIQVEWLFTTGIFIEREDLVTLHENLEALRAIVLKAYSIKLKLPNLEEITDEYEFFLRELDTRVKELQAMQDTVSKASDIYQKFPKSRDLAVLYMSILDCLAQRQEGWIYTTSKLEARNYIVALQDITEGLQDTFTKASDIYKKFQNEEDLAVRYMSIWSKLVSKQKNLEGLQDTFTKASEIYKKFPNSKDLLDSYMSILDRLASEQKEPELSRDIISKASEIYKKFSNEEDLAFLCISTLNTLVLEQKDIEELQNTITLIKDIYKRYSKDKIFTWYFSISVSNYIIKSLKYLPEEEKNKSKVNLEIIFDWVSDENVEFIVDIIDQMFRSANFLIELTDHNAEIIGKLLCGFSKIVSLQQTKYAILIGYLRDLEDKGCQLEPIIMIYCLVQIIKFQLSMKDFSKKDFGHYTSGEVLQILLKQSSDNKPSSDNQKTYSIEGRTRLGNVKYMNDPEEGSVLDKYIEFGKSNNLEDSLKPSPWFLMSLTTAIDDLAMWSQYGARAEGVCLVFKAESFEVANSMTETEWIVKKIFPTMLKEKFEGINNNEKDLSSKKDYLYRICYLDEKSLKDENLDIVKKKYNKMLDGMEIDTINNCLAKIKFIVSKIDENTILYDFVDDCLEEIRYLFKVSDYSYESELRILRYADLSPYNNNIKIDNSGTIAKLYLERDMPIQLKKVIFGPKFSNPEHVTPLLHLLDKDIEFKRSEIKFK